jgi:hypothetical protein
MRAQSGGVPFAATLSSCKFSSPSVFAFLPVHLGTSNRQIHEDLRMPFFEEYTRALTENYDTKLAGVGNLLVRLLGRYLP